MKIIEKDLNVEKLIKYAEKELIWIPEFQRPFVWDRSQIRLLIDSLFHDYTISSILFWEGQPELARRRVGGSIKEIKIPDDTEKEEVTYLLDGQQRTTALTLAFTDKAVYQGKNVRKKTSINLFRDTEYTGNDPERRWVYDDELIDIGDNSKGTYLCDIQQKDIFEKFGARFVKIKHAYNWAEISTDMINLMGGNTSLFVSYNNKINEIQKQILYRRVYDIEQRGTLEQVLEVFERINTQNTRLSIFDIMVAKTYKKIGENFFDLRTYLSVLNYKGSVKSDFFQNLDESNGIDLEGVKPILDDSDMLSIITIMLKQDYLPTSILKLKTDELMANTKLVHDRFHQILAMMHQHLFVEQAELIKYRPIIRYLSGFYGHFGNIDLGKQEFINKWFWNTLLKNRYPGSQNERLSRDLKNVKENQPSVALEKMMLDNTRSFAAIESASIEKPEYFEAYKSAPNQQIYTAMLLLIKSKNARDFYNGLIPAKNATIQFSLEEHHIFPDNSIAGKNIKGNYADHRRYSDIINNIANIALLTKETNNNRIKAKNPSVYFIEIENEYKKENKADVFEKILESQFITPEMLCLLRKDDFEGFLFLRTKELMKQINTLCTIIKAV